MNRFGVLPVDKPEGPTSHDVVARARRALGERRIGHTGTLDPFATGLLLLCVGRATRLAEYLTAQDKTYVAVARLGQETDTEDRHGVVVAESGGWRDLERSHVEEAVSAFLGEGEQVPPQYSAKKVDGEAMHRRARRGEHVELAPRPIRIEEVEVLEWTPPALTFRVRCSSGTYVRSLARDLGKVLGVGAHLTSLRRTAIGTVDVACALPLEDLESPGRVEAALMDPLAALAHLPRIDVDARQARALEQGRPLPGGFPDGAPVVVVHEACLLAVADVAGGVLRPRKVFPR